MFSFVDLPTVPFDENFVLSLSQALSFFHSTNAISIKVYEDDVFFFSSFVVSFFSSFFPTYVCLCAENREKNSVPLVIDQIM